MSRTRKTTKTATRKAARATSRVRPRGRTRLQQQQKDATRESLLAAAITAFTKTSYAATTVDHIILRAKVSRTSFYRHFDSKWAVARALLDQFGPAIRENWNKLPADGSAAQFEIWLTGILNGLRDRRHTLRMLREAEVIEPEASVGVARSREALGRLLGNRFPAFAYASGEDADLEAKTRLHLLMLQYEEFCNAVVVRRSLDAKMAARLMAEQFVNFMQEIDYRTQQAPLRAAHG